MELLNIFRRRIILILMGIFLLTTAASGILFRPWWFDEVLTLWIFTIGKTPAEIYLSYTIPNNQIVHSICLNLLCRTGTMPEYLRIFPLCCALLTIGLLYRGFRKECGTLALTAALGAWMLSAPFFIYATALRGYMLAALLVTLALLCGRKFAVSGKISALAGNFAATFLAVGVMPSALAGIAAAGLFTLPYFGKRFYRKRNFYLLVLAIPAAFLLFYVPIFAQLRQAAALREGWHSHAAALLSVTVALAAVFNLLIPAALCHSKRNFRTLCHLLIWLLPLGMMIFPAAPFPRVWWVIFPVLALTLARSLKGAEVIRKWWFIPVILAFLTNTAPVKNALSPLCSGAGQDDFFAPYFMRDDFVPFAAAAKLQTIPHRMVYASFDSDPWSLLPFVREKLYFDPPGRKIPALPDNTAVILARSEDPQTIIRRFGGSLTPAASAGRYTIYLWRQK